MAAGKAPLRRTAKCRIADVKLSRSMLVVTTANAMFASDASKSEAKLACARRMLLSKRAPLTLRLTSTAQCPGFHASRCASKNPSASVCIDQHLTSGHSTKSDPGSCSRRDLRRDAKDRRMARQRQGTHAILDSSGHGLVRRPRLRGKLQEHRLRNPSSGGVRWNVRRTFYGRRDAVRSGFSMPENQADVHGKQDRRARIANSVGFFGSGP